MAKHIIPIFKTRFSMAAKSDYYKHCLLAAFLTVMWLVLPGCLHKSRAIDIQEQLPETQQLEQELEAILGYHDDEVGRLAHAALLSTSNLSITYNITGPSRFHNFLVNLGIKERGLCCHWTKDLLQALEKLDLKKFRITWAVSNYGSFREHSSVAVVPKTQPFNHGLILDPWRQAGKLYWSKIDQDSYLWLPHPAYKDTAEDIDCESSLKI